MKVTITTQIDLKFFLTDFGLWGPDPTQPKKSIFGTNKKSLPVMGLKPPTLETWVGDANRTTTLPLTIVIG